jgi:hypothetical protein
MRDESCLFAIPLYVFSVERPFSQSPEGALAGEILAINAD